MSYNLEQAKHDLDMISPKESQLVRMLEISAILTKYMEYNVTKSHGLPIIVGGLSMEIYTLSEYVTHDIDFVTSSSLFLKELLFELGFVKNDRMYYFEPLNIAVDIVDNSLDLPAYDRLNKIYIDDEKYVISISMEDILYDRICDYKYADTKNYAIFLMSINFDEIDFKYLEERLEVQGQEFIKVLYEWKEVARKIDKEIKKNSN